MGKEHGEDDKEEDSEGRTGQEKGILVGEGTKWEGSMGKTTRKKILKEGQKKEYT
jgi:hypothetical protein